MGSIPEDGVKQSAPCPTTGQTLIENDLEGRLALITGRQEGLSIAQSLFAEGVSLALTYWTNKASLEGLVDGLTTKERGQKVSLHHIDVSSQSDLERLFEEIEQGYGRRPDILISNAGYGKRISDIMDIPIEEFDKMIRINLRPSFILSKLAVPHMVSQGWGRIIFVTSIAAIGGGINGCHYAASKAGLTGLMKNLSSKLAKDGVTVNDVSPAMIGDTGMIPDAKMLAGTAGDPKNIPVGRLGTPQECANVVNMLCKTGYLTGQSILLAGGLR